MATDSSIFVWKIPWTEDLGSLQPTGSQRVGMTEYAHRHTHKVCIIRMRETYQQEANKASQTEAYKGYQSVRSVFGAMHLLSDFPKFVDFLFFFLSLFISSHLGAFLLHKGLTYLHQKFHVFSWSSLVHSLYCLLFSLVTFLIFFYSHAYPDVGFLFIVTFSAGFCQLSFACVMTHFLDHGTRIGGFFKPCSGQPEGIEKQCARSLGWMKRERLLLKGEITAFQNLWLLHTFIQIQPG